MADEEVAKGKTLADGTYLFTCGHCNGSGRYGTEDCTWCYGLDTQRIVAAMREGARGARYYGLLKSFLSINGKAMADEFKVMKASGIVTPVEIGYIALKYGLNFKATWEWLFETGCISVDYDDVTRDFKVAETYAIARERYPELAKELP